MRSSLTRHIPFALSLLAGLALWEIVGRNSSPAFLAPLSTTLVRLWQLLADGTLVTETLDSGALFLAGFLLSIAVGVPAGLMLARIRILRVALEPYLTILYATPMVALIPFILSLMGFGFVPKMLVVFLFGVFPILYNTIEGARSIKPEMIEVARSFRSGEWSLWRDVMLPYTLPFAMTGIRLAIGRCLVGMVAAEFFLSSNGLGQLIMSASENFDTGALFAGIAVICVIGVGLMRLGVMLEKRFSHWRI